MLKAPLFKSSELALIEPEISIPVPNNILDPLKDMVLVPVPSEKFQLS
jgi:hypothetical protein